MLLDIKSIVKIAGDGEIVVRMINSLYKAGYTTIGDMMNIDFGVLSEIKGFGVKSEDYFLELVKQIHDDPEKFRALNKSELIKSIMRDRGYIK